MTYGTEDTLVPYSRGRLIDFGRSIIFFVFFLISFKKLIDFKNFVVP
jgi:hypothetical protein